MDAATASGAEAPARLELAPGTRRRRRAAAASGPRPRRVRLRVALGLLLLLTLALRLWGVRQGLPYSYNSDEATHFVPRAIDFFGHDLNPQYFLNPPAYSYLLHFVFELWFGSADVVRRTFVTDPTAVFVVARVVAAVLGTIAVWLTYLTGERLWNATVGLVAAAIFGLSFLPIFYSHLALNDVPTLAPVALALYGAAGILRNGARREYVLAGVGIGLASATKYTGGFAAICLLGAFACDAAGGGAWRSLRRLGLAIACALLAFVAANPYSVLDWNTFHAGISMQQALAGGALPVKLGTTSSSGTASYIWTFTWGLGWVPTLAAVGGAALLLIRRRLALAVVLLPAPIAFILYMGDQQRFFGRWLMPTFPIVALLGAYAVVELVRWVIASRRLPAAPVWALAAIVLLAQSVTSVVHNDLVLSRADTRNLTRDWMVAHIPAGAKVVIEPVVSDDWAYDIGRSLPWTATGARWERWNPYVTDVDPNGVHLPPGIHRYVAVDQYERTLRPELIDEYEQGGYCWVVIGSLQAGRSFAQPKIAPQAIAYYAQLSNDGRLEYHISPFAPGSRAVPFSFDWSIDYYPPAYSRPGPEMSVYHLTGGRCAVNTIGAGHHR